MVDRPRPHRWEHAHPRRILDVDRIRPATPTPGLAQRAATSTAQFVADLQALADLLRSDIVAEQQRQSDAEMDAIMLRDIAARLRDDT